MRAHHERTDAGKKARSGFPWASGRPRRKATRLSHPRLEVLEERVVLSPTIYVVNSPGNSTAGTGDSGTLPYVVSQANANTNPDGSEIQIVLSGGGIPSGEPRTISLADTLVLSETPGPEVIDRLGANSVTIAGGPPYRVFEIEGGVTASLSGLTISGGFPNFYDGGLANYGGGLANFSTVTLSGCTISGNSTDSSGGGLYNLGTATLSDCTISGNSAFSGGGGLADYSGTTTLTDTIVAVNTDGFGYPQRHRHLRGRLGHRHVRPDRHRRVWGDRQWLERQHRPDEPRQSGSRPAGG
jgi:hypothetical protein